MLTEKRPQVSPSGEYILEYERKDSGNVRGATFVIYTNDENHERVYESDHGVWLRFTNFILWDKEVDRVWMYDGDTGIYFTEELDGTWQRFTWYPYEGQRYWFNDTDTEEVYISSINGVINHWPEEYPGEVKMPELLTELRPHLREE